MVWYFVKHRDNFIFTLGKEVLRLGGRWNYNQIHDHLTLQPTLELRSHLEKKEKDVLFHYHIFSDSFEIYGIRPQDSMSVKQKPANDLTMGQFTLTHIIKPISLGSFYCYLLISISVF
jgi:hypothetical protein